MGIYNKDFVQRTVLNEVYFGETSDIKKLQSCLSAFRKRCMKDKDSKAVKANTYEELIAFNRQAEKTFGFVNFCLTVQSSCGVNACTFPITSTLDAGNHKKYLAPTKDGIKYTKEANYSCIVFIYYDLLLMKSVTDREILAILLHEIGHNFSSNFDKKIDIFDDIKYSYMISDLITDAANAAVRPLKAIETIKDTIQYGSKYSVMFSNSLEKYMNQHLPNVVVARDTMKRIISNALNVVKQLYLITGHIGKIIAMENDPIKYIEDWLDGKKQKTTIKTFVSVRGLLSHLLGYNDEKLADSFATMYGYGDDLAKGLVKIEGLETKHYKNNKGEVYEYPLYIHFLNLVIMPINILFCASSPHPTITARLYNQIDYLEKEIKRNNIDPKMEKEIKKQIQDIKKIMQKDILEPGRNKDKADINMVSKMYYAYLYDKFEGGDYRNNIYKKTDLHKQIQDIYNDKRKK